MEVLYKKTTELSDEEIQGICEVFDRVFVDHTKTLSDFKNEFLNTDFGYSFHGLLVSNGTIVGSQSYIPFIYLINGVSTNVALSVDTMILEEFRNFDNIFDLWLKGHKLLKNDNFAFTFGFPNENAYPLLVKGLREKDIGDLSTYILPYKIGAIKKNLAFLNAFSKVASKALVNLSVLARSRQTKSFKIQKNRENFDCYRYKWFDGKYKKVDLKTFVFYHKIKTHQGVKTAFLIDVFPLNQQNFDKAVRYIVENESNNFDIILYIGDLHFKPLSLIKLPKKLQPKTFHFTAKILNKELIDANMLFDINNWDVNLSNYDLL